MFPLLPFFHSSNNSSSRRKSSDDDKTSPPSFLHPDLMGAKVKPGEYDRWDWREKVDRDKWVEINEAVIVGMDGEGYFLLMCRIPETNAIRFRPLHPTKVEIGPEEEPERKE
jgi:hypothetical protein